MESIKKAAAILCSAAALAVFGAAAFPAGAFETVNLDDRAAELKPNTVNIIADQVYAEPGETVDYRVLLSGNTGYSDSGIALVYDSALTVKQEGEDDPVMEVGEAAGSLMTEDSLNLDERIIAFSSIGTTNSTQDGMLFTVHLTVPANAEEGATYPLKLEIRHFLDKKQVEVSHATVDGWIKIRKPVVTTTSTAPVTTVRTTTVVTTSTAPVTTVITTNAPVTTIPVPVTEPPVDVTEAPPVTTVTEPVVVPPVTTKAPEVTEPVTSKTKRSLDPNHGVTTAKGGTKAGAVQTGEAGSGAAVTGLLLALGTAAAMNKRRKDD